VNKVIKSLSDVAINVLLFIIKVIYVVYKKLGRPIANKDSIYVVYRGELDSNK